MTVATVAKNKVVNARRSLNSVVVNQPRKKKLEQSALGRQDLGRAFHKKKGKTSGKAMTKAKFIVQHPSIDVTTSC